MLGGSFLSSSCSCFSAWACHLLRDALCFSAHVEQRLWSGMASKRQTTQSPDSFAFRRRSCSWRRCCSLRSGEVFPFRSCSNGSRSLASTSVVAGSGWGFVCWAFGFAFRGGVLVELFRGGFPAGFVLVGGRPPALLGPGNGNVESKVRPTTRRGGGTRSLGLTPVTRPGLSPRVRGNRMPLPAPKGLARSIPASAGPP